MNSPTENITAEISSPINMDSLPQEQLKQFLEPYTKEELETMILACCDENDDVLNSLMRKVKTDKKWCKLFVHGLAFTTNNEALEKHYEKYGKVKEAVVLVDKRGNSRGYGFVTFSNADEALHAVKSEKKKIDNRITHCNLAWKGNPKKGWNAGALNQPLSVQARQEANDRRLFVHSLAWKTDDDSLRNAFRDFGELVEAVVIRDKKTGKSKGYGFVTFRHAESARTALTNAIKVIDGRKTRCNYASTRDTKLYTDSEPNDTSEMIDSNVNPNANAGGYNINNDHGGNNNNNNNSQLVNGLNNNNISHPSSSSNNTGVNSSAAATAQHFLGNVAGINNLQGFFPEDFGFAGIKQRNNSMMYDINQNNMGRPTLTNFGSNSSFGGLNPTLFSMPGNSNQLILGNSLSNGFSNLATKMNDLSLSSSHMQNINNTNGNNKSGIIVHSSSNHIQVPNTPPMYAHLSSPVKAPSVSSAQSLLAPAPVPLVSFNTRIFNN